MFLAIRYLDVYTVKMQRRVLSFVTFMCEAHSSSLFVSIRVEGHLPLESAFTYFFKVRLELSV